MIETMYPSVSVKRSDSFEFLSGGHNAHSNAHSHTKYLSTQADSHKPSTLSVSSSMATATATTAPVPVPAPAQAAAPDAHSQASVSSISSNTDSMTSNKAKSVSTGTSATSATSAASAMAASMRELASDFPFLRADHVFDASSLANSSGERDPSSICLSFSEGDVVYAHWVHDSGWGDVTHVHTGRRGWIPINYFSPFTDTAAIPLLSAAANFIAAPKSFQLLSSDSSFSDSSSSSSTATYSFSQAAINEIVSGVRALLDLSGTLNRDSPMAQRSQTVRRHRKALLTELAYLVSIAKQFKKSTDDAVIEKLVRGTYRIVDKAAVLLDVWTAEKDTPSSSQSSIDSASAMAAASQEAQDATDTAIKQLKNSSNADSNAKKPARPRSLQYHSTLPDAASRLDEVSGALCEYLNVFVHGVSELRDDPTASVQVLGNTRHCMLACRELLVVVEAISSSIFPRNSELEWLKDAMFPTIRQLVGAARQVVASFSLGEDKIEIAAVKLSGVARECARITCECTAWCHAVLEKDDVAIPVRDYPEFKRSTNRKANTMTALSSPNSDAAYTDSKAYPPSPTSSVEDSGIAQWSSEVEPSTKPTSPLLTPEPEQDEEDKFEEAPARHERTIDDRESNDRSISSKRTSMASTSSDSTEFEDDVTPTNIKLNSQELKATNMGSTTTFDISSGSSSRSSSTSKALPALNIDSAQASRNEVSTLPQPRSFAEGQPMTPVTPSSEPRPMNQTERELAAIHPELWVRNDKVRAGTVPGLLAWLTDPLADASSISAFLFTFRFFSSPKFVAVNLLSLFKSSSVKKQDSIVEFALLWVESFWRSPDEEAEAELCELAGLSKNEVLIDSLEKRQSTTAKTQLVERALDAPSRQSSFIIPHNSSASTQSSLRRGSVISRASLSRKMSHEDMRTATWNSAFRFGSNNNNETATKLLDYDAGEIAQRLFVMDCEIFAGLQPDELLDQRFSSAKRSQGLAPHVVQLVLISNHLSAFVGDTVLGSENVSAKTRKNVIRMWIRVAEKSYELGNLNALVTIISTLQSSNIVRLRKIWDMMSPKNVAILERLSRLAAPDRNFAEYRNELRSRKGQACVPYIGLYLSDLTLLDEGSPKCRNVHGLQMINFDRYRRTAEIIANLQEFQRTVPYSGSSNVTSSLLAWLRTEMAKSHTALAQDMDGQWRRSCVIEPKA